MRYTLEHAHVRRACSGRLSNPSFEVEVSVLVSGGGGISDSATAKSSAPDCFRCFFCYFSVDHHTFRWYFDASASLSFGPATTSCLDIDCLSCSSRWRSFLPLPSCTCARKLHPHARWLKRCPWPPQPTPSTCEQKGGTRTTISAPSSKLSVPSRSNFRPNKISQHVDPCTISWPRAR